MKYHELLQAAVNGTVWNGFAFASGKGLTFISTIILARILLPEDFGLMALAIVFLEYLAKLHQLGVGDALIYRQGKLGDLGNTAFSLSITMGIILACITFFIAPLIASFFSEPRVIPIIRVLSVWFIINSFGNTQESIFGKELDFRRRSIPELVRGIVKGIVSIGLALLGYGVWSLVWGQLAGTLVKTLLYYNLCHWKPRLSFHLNTAGLLLRYGLQSSAFNLLHNIYINVDYLIVGRRLDTTHLGFYNLAFRLPDIAITGIQDVIATVLFPVYAKLQQDRDSLRKGVFLAIQYVALFSIPAGIGIYWITPEFVEIFYSARWMPIVPVMKALAIYAMITSISTISDHIYRATGELAAANRISLIRLFMTVLVLWICAGHGILAVAIGQIGVAIFSAALNFILVKQIIALTFSDLCEGLKPAVACAAVMMTGILVLSWMLEAYSPVIRFIAIVGSGSLLYVSMLWFFYRNLIKQVAAAISSGKK